jgi:hypothetical protein
VFFVGLAVVWSFPLVLRLSTHLTGSIRADNIAGLWNFWWVRTALESGDSLFFTPLLFAPSGVDLTFHTLTLLPALSGATVLAALPVTVALNLSVLVSLFLNGFCAYLLAWRLTRRRAAAVIAGIIFGGSPYVAAHLGGHYNLTAAWTLPLFAIALHEGARGSVRWAAVAGAIASLTVYIDYYYVLFQGVLTLCTVAATAVRWSWSHATTERRPGGVLTLVLVLLVIDLLLLIVIVVTGGFTYSIERWTISARNPFNLQQAFWCLALLALVLVYKPRIGMEHIAGQRRLAVVRQLLIATAVFLIGAAPVIWHAAQVALRGDYVSQEYFWRSGPRGVDLGSLLMGPPFHGLWGRFVQARYDLLQINTVEMGGWLGLAAPVLALLAVRKHWHVRQVRYWTAVAAVFFVWALGAHLYVFGWNTGMILPQALLRYLPIFGNARMSGRAIVIVYLAIAMLAAFAVADWRATKRISGASLLALATLILVDYLPAPYATTRLESPTVYRVLGQRPEAGTLLELPVGWRDGFRTRGHFDERVLGYQTIHGRPIIGGSVSRLSRTVAEQYEADPLLRTLLDLSEGKTDGILWITDTPRQDAAELLQRQGIKFVVLNQATASDRLRDYVSAMLPLKEVTRDGAQILYEVEVERRLTTSAP